MNAKMMQIVKDRMTPEVALRTALGCLVYASMAYVHAPLAKDTLLPRPSQTQLATLMVIAQSYVLLTAQSEAALRASANVGVKDKEASSFL